MKKSQPTTNTKPSQPSKPKPVLNKPSPEPKKTAQIIEKKPVNKTNATANIVPNDKANVVLNQEIINSAIDAHNNLRKLHNAPPLKHNAELSKIAQVYADHLAKTDTFEHSKNTYNGKWMGENLSMCMGMAMTGEGMSQRWYDEIKNYNYEKPGFGMKTGHFTQVVWKGTEEVGFGVAKSKTGKFYAVGNYYPGGNMMSAFEENVLPLSKPGKKEGEEVKIEKDDIEVKNVKANMKKQIVIDNEEKKIEVKTEKKTTGTLDLAFINEAIAKHNVYRKIHGAPELKHNEELSRIAQGYAEKIVASGEFEHSKNQYENQPMGENLAMCFGKKMTGEMMTTMWYNEVKAYNYQKPGFQGGTGHFTQVVWKETREAGFGLGITKDGKYYAVGNYFPAGNYQGQFKENVMAPKK